MGSELSFVEFIVEQIDSDCDISFKKMFGEYALYSKSKVVALICDDQLFVKPTKSGRAFIGNVIEKSAYPGAKPSFLIEEQIEDTTWLSELIRVSYSELPDPKPKKKKKPKLKSK